MSWKVFGRRWQWPPRGTIPRFFLQGLRKPTTIISHNRGYPAEIRNEHFPNASLQRHC
jgi:hypothetical protein